MKAFLLWIVSFTAVPGGAAFAQNIAGTWQGSLQGPAGRSLRTVIKISRADDESLRAVLYSIDQGGQPLNASAMTQQGSTVKMAIAAIGGNYEGKLGADGNSITGTWTQGGPPAPLNLTRATPQTAWTIPDPPPPVVRMAANANPEFEVATIKPSDPSRPGKLFTVRGQNVVTVNTTVSDLIIMAYNLHPRQISGGPAWFESEKYDITGKPDVPGQPSVDQIKVMIGKLLTDRFQLKFHREKKELGVYAITLLKTGAKLAKSQSDPTALPGLFFQRGPAGVNFNVRNATIMEVGAVLQGSVLDKPVVDQTGLPEKYDFTLKFTPEGSQMASFGGPQQPPAADNPDAPPDLFTAFQQQLGMKLESTKAPVDVLVIDRVAKPSDN